MFRHLYCCEVRYLLEICLSFFLSLISFFFLLLLFIRWMNKEKDPFEYWVYSVLTASFCSHSYISLSLFQTFQQQIANGCSFIPEGIFLWVKPKNLLDLLDCFPNFKILRFYVFRLNIKNYHFVGGNGKMMSILYGFSLHISYSCWGKKRTHLWIW